jgi:hypothetical protein
MLFPCQVMLSPKAPGTLTAVSRAHDLLELSIVAAQIIANALTIWPHPGIPSSSKTENSIRAFLA